MAFPYVTFSSQDIDNLVTYRKIQISVQNAHPVFNQVGQGCCQHLREDAWPAFSSSFFPFLPQERRLGARAAPNGYQGEEGPHPWTQGREPQGISNTNTGPSWRQGTHNVGPRWEPGDAAPKSPGSRHRGPEPVHPVMPPSWLSLCPACICLMNFPSYRKLYSLSLLF